MFWVCFATLTTWRFQRAEWICGTRSKDAVAILIKCCSPPLPAPTKKTVLRRIALGWVELITIFEWNRKLYLGNARKSKSNSLKSTQFYSNQLEQAQFAIKTTVKNCLGQFNPISLKPTQHPCLSKHVLEGLVSREGWRIHDIHEFYT